MKKTTLTFTLLCSVIFGSSSLSITDQELSAHRFNVNSGARTSLLDSSPPLVFLGAQYKYQNTDNALFSDTSLSIDLGITPIDERSIMDVIKTHSEKAIIIRMMTSFIRLSSHPFHYFLSIGTHSSFSYYQELAEKEDSANSERFVKGSNVYIGPSINIGMEIFTSKVHHHNMVFLAGYDYPFISHGLTPPQRGSFYLSCGFGF